MLDELRSSGEERGNGCGEGTYDKSGPVAMLNPPYIMPRIQIYQFRFVGLKKAIDIPLQPGMPSQSIQGTSRRSAR